MKKINQSVRLLIAFVLLSVVVAASPVKLDFNGVWKIDLTKSDLGGLPIERSAPTKIRLVNKKNVLSFERSFQNLPPIDKESLTMDGVEVQLKYEDRQIKRTLILPEDKSMITVTSNYHVTSGGKESWDYTRVETYALAKDGKSLLLTRISTLPDGKQEIVKAHYHRV